MLNLNIIKKEIIKRLEEKEIIVNCIRVRGYNKEERAIKSVKISLGNYDIGSNVLYEVKTTLDNIQIEFNLDIAERFVEF